MSMLFACAGAASHGALAPALSAAGQREPAGKRVYLAECAPCHGKQGEGGGQVPALMGSGELPRTRSGRGEFATARDLFEYVRTQMPLPKSRIGKLSENEYESVTRYVLAVHGVTWAPGQDPATVQLVP